MVHEIDLTALTKDRVRMLSGHDRGSEARKFFDIDRLEAEDDEIVIVAPDSLDAVTPSFVQGLFAQSKTLPFGRDGFLRKYRFNTSEFVKEDILVGIDRLLMKRSLTAG